jgi:hypothetical protein
LVTVGSTRRNTWMMVWMRGREDQPTSKITLVRRRRRGIRVGRGLCLGGRRVRFSWGLEREPCICVHDLCFLSTLATASGLAAANSYCYCWGILLPLSPFGSRKTFFALRIPPYLRHLPGAWLGPLQALLAHTFFGTSWTCRHTS